MPCSSDPKGMNRDGPACRPHHAGFLARPVRADISACARFGHAPASARGQPGERGGGHAAQRQDVPPVPRDEAPAGRRRAPGADALLQLRGRPAEAPHLRRGRRSARHLFRTAPRGPRAGGIPVPRRGAGDRGLGHVAAPHHRHEEGDRVRDRFLFQAALGGRRHRISRPLGRIRALADAASGSSSGATSRRCSAAARWTAAR